MDEILKDLLGEKRVTWYHASGLDGHPIMALRAMANWSFGTDEQRKMFCEIGSELRNTVLVYNDTSRSIYRNLINSWERIKSQERIGMSIPLFPGLVTDSIEPFTLLNDSERAEYQAKNYYESRSVADREFDGFIIKLPWFKVFPDLYDTIVFLCLDDIFVKEIFRKHNAKVIAFFEHNAGHEGSLKLMDFYTADEFSASSTKYLFTDKYDFCIKTGGYLLSPWQYPDVWNRFSVFNFVRKSRNILQPVPTPLPEHELEKYEHLPKDYCDICKHYKESPELCRGNNYTSPLRGGGFCLAIRKS